MQQGRDGPPACGEIGQPLEGLWVKRVERPASGHGPDSFEELEGAEPGESVAEVVGDAEQADEVFDVGGVEVADAAVLHERDPPLGKLELEQTRVMPRPHQRCLLSECGPLLVCAQDLVADLDRLLELVSAVDELRAGAALAVRA